MTLSTKWLIEERANLGGVQRLYDMGHGWRLSAVNSTMLHFYSFAWEFAVLGPEGVIEYGTELTDDVVVCKTDEDAEEFLIRARGYFDEKGTGHAFTTREQEKAKREKWREDAKKFIEESKAERESKHG